MIRSDKRFVNQLFTITDELVTGLEQMVFSDPVSHIYNPLVYAKKGYEQYIRRFGKGEKPVILLGMNPGPFGMVQTGVPFGDVQMVKNWMGINTSVLQPDDPHPKRPVSGFACTRKEVSGSRLWGWAKERFGEPEPFFKRFLVLNYCPLAFMEMSGRNRTPDKLPIDEKKRLFDICDRALVQTIHLYCPQWVIGIGGFAEKRIKTALKGMGLNTGRIIHPSPANPIANRGWAIRIESELAAMGVALPDFEKDPSV